MKPPPFPAAQLDICMSESDDCQPAVPSSGKRTFSDMERSPELLETRAKKTNADYERFFEIPEETARNNTGLTGTFSTIQIRNLATSTEANKAAGQRNPRRSSPIPVAVAKSLFCELEEPAEDVFEDGAKDLSRCGFTSPLPGNADVCRSLSLDSDGSMHETSLVECNAASHPNKSPESGNLVSSEQQKSSESPPQGQSEQRGESQCSLLNRIPDVSCGVSQSPSFLKPRNVVVFRSYCSSINRSNMSGASRLSLGSVEAMDVSSAASYHSAWGTATPVQRRRRSNSSFNHVSWQFSNFSPQKISKIK